MHAWKKKKSLLKGVSFSCELEVHERQILGNLAATVAEALIERAQSAPKDELAELTGMPSGHTVAPEDPGLARLLPDFEREGDEEYEGDNGLLRALNETEITKEKLAGLSAISHAIGPGGSEHIKLSEPEALLWLRALNDIRLFFAASEIAQPDESRDRDQIVEWLAYNQDSLLQAVMGEA
ncbi:DUF2017 domain-containing protein [Corynebacterium sp. ES2730-CONJ]|uniref:DUF2017 domain-containing protein n=1 Tax=Corynebacterium sp. ES2730-CONJ TaxID=2973941 RepID=UPI00216B0E77|nr:DUF2017 domain-containing protein [Corynebacterium sp. ES2730-CONJ]MCS4532585.1 DUF2017 domain-containing protein [Corynebacterium sp. ES2730-CONJ]